MIRIFNLLFIYICRIFSTDFTSLHHIFTREGAFPGYDLCMYVFNNLCWDSSKLGTVLTCLHYRAGTCNLCAGGFLVSVMYKLRDRDTRFDLAKSGIIG